MVRHHLLLAALMVSPVAGVVLPGSAQTGSMATPASQSPATPVPEATASGGSLSTGRSAPAQPPGSPLPSASAAALQDPPPQALPLAPALKGDRPRSNPSVLPPAATVLPPDLQRLAAPASLALPDKPSQVRIRELRPLSLSDVETLAEVNNPSLKALASQVDQAASALRAEISLWYPQLNLNAAPFPTYTGGQDYSNRSVSSFISQPRGLALTSIWQMSAVLQASWGLINPARNPRIAIARDNYEKAKNQYLIGLREVRLQAAKLYFDLQDADEQVRIGQESVRSSQVSLRDARARYQAGVATKLEVLQAETQLARDQQLLTSALLGRNISNGRPGQAAARRNLAQLLALPQDVTPTAKDPSRVLGVWLPSLQESIVAAYTFREELDQALLDISRSNSQANAQLAEVQPFLNIVNNLTGGRTYGYRSELANSNGIFNQETWSVDNSVGLNFGWKLFDGGRARALYRQEKQAAQENRFRFADRRDQIRQEVEESFYLLDQNNRNISTTSREVISARESLRLARLRFQAGVTTQREVVDTQRDLTQAEVRYSSAIADYNRNLADLRRRTGLDQIALCPAVSLPSTKPVVPGVTDVPVEPQPLVPACQAKVRPGDASDQLSAPLTAPVGR